MSDNGESSQESSSDEENWEQVQIQQPIQPEEGQQGERPQMGVVVIGGAASSPAKTKRAKSTQPSKEERLIRSETHKVHFQCLLLSVYHRNKWCQRPILQATALSLIPSDLFSEFIQKISPKNTNNSEHFEKLLDQLKIYWEDRFTVKENKKALIGFLPILDDMQQYLSGAKKSIDPDTSTLFLTSALRALGLRVRLIAALYPIPLSLAKSQQKTPSRPFTLWCEVYNKFTSEWVNLSDNLELACPYILAYSTKGIKELTWKYTLQSSKQTKSRIDAQEKEWYDTVMWLFKSDHEQQETEQKKDEPFPKTFSGFLNHPVYALERHLKKCEAIVPGAVGVGEFKGEVVYKREDFGEVLSKENWIKQGLVIKPDEQPARIGVARAVTINKKRLLNSMTDGKGIKPGNALYGRWQTTQFTPPTIPTTGIIPKNSFGNYELFHPTMLPSHCVHLPYSGIAKTAKALSIPFAPAMIGFTFRCGRATPNVEGVIVLSKFEDALLSGHKEVMEKEEIEAERKREERVLGRWKDLVKKVCGRDRLRREYEVEIVSGEKGVVMEDQQDSEQGLSDELSEVVKSARRRKRQRLEE